MAGIKRTIIQSFSAVNGATVLAHVNAPANQRLKILKIGLYFKGTSTTDPPALIEWGPATVDTPGDALTIRTADPGVTETTQIGGGVKGTATPAISAFTPVVTARRHPQSYYEHFRPDDNPLPIKGGQKHALRVTTAAAVDIEMNIEVEE